MLLRRERGGLSLDLVVLCAIFTPLLDCRAVWVMGHRLVGILAAGALALLPLGAKGVAAEFVSVPDVTGESLRIPRSVIKLTPVYRGALFVDMQKKVAEQQKVRQLYGSCLSQFDGYQCWRMYGEDVSRPKLKIPAALQWLQADPLYVVLQFRLVRIDLNKQASLGDEGLVVCLNPHVPRGYWPEVNKFRPILKQTPGGGGAVSTPMEILKAKACAAFVAFPSYGSRQG